MATAPKWVHFTEYWLGLSLLKYRPFNNSFPHCLDYRPTFYHLCKTHFDNFIRDFPFVDLTTITVGKVYDVLLSKLFVPPRIEAKFPAIDFQPVWRGIHDKFVDPEIRNCNFRVTHQVLPTNAFLFQYGISDFAHCTFCGRTHVETLEHLFIGCKQVAPLWFFVKSTFWRLCNHRLKVTRHLVLFTKFEPPLQAPVGIRHMSVYFVGLVKFCVWKLRCSVKYDHRTFDGVSCLRLFQKLLRLRIRTDFLRYEHSPDRFLSTWACGNVLCARQLDGSLMFHF